MIIDFNCSTIPANFQAGVCIVGAGAIGLTLASEFLDHHKLDILIIESGGLIANKGNASLDEVINTGDVESGVEGSRSRVFGGSSTAWGGQALPFLDADFFAKDWIKNSGWPLTSHELKPFYERAADLLNLEDNDFLADIWPAKISEQKLSEINNQTLKLSHSKWSPQPDLSKKFKRSIDKSNHVTTLINASVTEIIPSLDSNVISEIKLKNLAGKHGVVKAEIFILCGGGIENPRLLLASNSVLQAGVGNINGNVGRYYQDHIGVYGARLVPKDFKTFHGLFASVLKGNQKLLPKINLSEKIQHTKNLLNVNGNISVNSNSDSAINSLKNTIMALRENGLSKQAVGSVLKLSKSAPELFRIFNSYYLKKRVYFPQDAAFFLIANCESEPIGESNIKLHSKRDALGGQLAQINWKLTDLSRASLVVYYQEVKKVLKKTGIAEVIIRPELVAFNSESWKSRCYSLYHHMGATRMHENLRHGVVDADCKVHDFSNLYIAGSSVFPTSSASNPTYTAMALAIRLADHIKKETKI